MRNEILHLKEAFPFLGEQGRDPTVTLLLPDNLAAHYANCYDHPQLREVFPDSKPVQASILCYAVLRSPAASKPHSLTNRRIAGTDDPTRSS